MLAWWLQGLELAAVKERLALPAFAAAVHDVLRCCVEALPALKGVARQEVRCLWRQQPFLRLSKASD